MILATFGNYLCFVTFVFVYFLAIYSDKNLYKLSLAYKPKPKVMMCILTLPFFM